MKEGQGSERGRQTQRGWCPAAQEGRTGEVVVGEAEAREARARAEAAGFGYWQVLVVP